MKLKPWMFGFTVAALLAVVGLIGPVAPSAAANDKQDQDGRPALSPLASGGRGGQDNGRRATDLPPTLLSTLLWDNGPFNNVDGLASEEDTSVSSARTADDFVLTSAATINTITFDIYADTPTSQPGAVDIYADSGGSGPVNALPLATYTSTTFTIVGTSFGFDIRRYSVTLSPPLNLAAGRYWVSGYVIGTGGSERGFFCTATPAPAFEGEEACFRSTAFSYPGQPNWVRVNVIDPSFGTTPKRDFAFTVSGTSGKVNVNANVNLVTTLSAYIPTSPCPPNYIAQFFINANLVNTGATVLGNPEFRVVELQHANGTPPPNPYRLRTADDYVACNTGGVVGSTQQVAFPPYNLAAGDAVPVAFQIDLPGPTQPRRFRFFVNVFAVLGPVSDNAPERNKGLPKRKLGQLAIEVTGYDAAGEPQLAVRFTPERKLPGGLRVDVQGVKGALVRR